MVRMPVGLHDVLEAEGDAVQRPAPAPGRDLGIGSLGFGQRPLGGDGDVGLQERVQPLDPVQVEAGGLDGAGLAGTDAAAELGRPQPGQLVVAHRLSSSG